jgi:hypothetical protein
MASNSGSEDTEACRGCLISPLRESSSTTGRPLAVRQRQSNGHGAWMDRRERCDSVRTCRRGCSFDTRSGGARRGASPSLTKAPRGECQVHILSGRLLEREHLRDSAVGREGRQERHQAMHGMRPEHRLCSVQLQVGAWHRSAPRVALHSEGDDCEKVVRLDVSSMLFHDAGQPRGSQRTEER